VDEGVVMHSAALALLQDELALDTGSGRGQAKALLPILEDVGPNLPFFSIAVPMIGASFVIMQMKMGGERSLSPHSGEPIAEYGTIIDFLKDAKI